jgi:hypothetical protein
MTLDRRIPGIYIDVEDRSLALETNSTGRSGYVVILSDRGRHNQVVELNSRADLYTEFGKPDFMKYGQGHYMADKFLTYSNRLFVVRPALLDQEFSTILHDNQERMAISNAFVKLLDLEKLPDGYGTDLDGLFTFNEDNDINGSNIVLADSTSIFHIGQFICIEDEYETLYQILNIDIAVGIQELTIFPKFTGLKFITSAETINPVEIDSVGSDGTTFLRNIDTLDINDADSGTMWYFYAIGAGAFYNSITIKGVRNTQLEKMYTDNDGNPLYPYMFMDLTIYRTNDDNSISTLEGPFSVSLVDRLPGGQLIRDIFSGLQLHFPTVINNQSKYIRCIENVDIVKLMTVESGITYPYGPDISARKLVQSAFLDVEQNGLGGVVLQNGRNGNLFTANGNLLFFGNDEYNALVAQAYNGSLESIDGTIELLPQSIYPLYLLDYVLCGGYTSTICNAARELVDVRGDCLLLSDTGQVSTSAQMDLIARDVEVPWNTWNAALYVMYQEIVDTNTGKRFNISPVYHAIERHLYVDTNYWLSEPVAGIEKGAISAAIKLAYKANLTKLGDLIEHEMNPVISEPDGIYLLTQFSCWKRLSIMKRLHAVKFIHFIKKEIPKLLKDILQRKATPYWLNQCNLRINGLMNQYLVSSSTDKYSTLKSYSCVNTFDDVRSEINSTLSITFLRAIERINVSIITY